MVRIAVITFLSLWVLPHSALAAGESSQSFTLNGTLFSQNDFTSPLLDASAQLKIQILDPSKNCVVYEETQTVDTTSTSGVFNIQVGSNTGAGKRSGDDPGHAMADIFQNVANISATNAGCPGSVYNPSSGDQRYLKLTLTPSSTGVPEVLSPDMPLTSVSNALVCESVQGLDRDKLAEFGTHINAAMTAANLLKLFDGSDVASLHNHDAEYAKLSNSNSIELGTQQTIGFGEFTNAQETTLTGGLGAGDAGKTWYNSDTNTLMYWDGSSAQAIGSGGGGAITSVFGRTGVVTAAASDYDANQIDNTPAGNIAATDVQAAITELDNEKLALSGGTMSGIINMNDNNLDMGTGSAKIVDLADPTNAQDAATKAYVDSSITTNNGSFVAKAGDSMTGALAMGTNKVTGVGDPTSAQDAATKNYVDTKLIGQTLPSSPTAGQNGQALRWNNGSSVWEYYTPASGGLSDIVNDTTPQLGGTLDINGQNMSTAAGFNIDITGSSAGNDFTVDTDKLVVEGDTGNVGVGTATPDASALLDVSSTTKGFLPPRMTTTQRDAVASPAEGLTVFNTTTNKLNVYAGSTWTETGSGGSFGSGNSGFVGSLVYPVTASCVWSNTATSFADFPADSDCSSPVVEGAGLAPDVAKAPAIKVASLPAGRYRVTANSLFYSPGGECSFKISDGTNTAGYVNAVASTSDRGALLIGEFKYNSAQTNINFTIQSARPNAGSCEIHNSATPHQDTFRISIERIDGQGTAVELADADANTKIMVEKNADENIIRFDTAGTERMTINASGAVNVVGSLTAGTLVGDASGVTNIGAAAIADGSITVADVDFASSNGINIPQLASDPGSPTAGQMYYNTSTNKMMIYNGSSFVEVGSSSGGGPSTQFYAHTTTNTSGFSGSKTMIFGTEVNDPDNQYNNANGEFTISSAATIQLVAGHAHLGGTHSVCETRIVSNLKGTLAKAHPTGGIATTISTIVDAAAGEVFTVETQHSNSGHADDNTGRQQFFGAFSLDGGSTGTSTNLADDDADTKIQVEESSDEDIIRFDTAGTERMTINSSGAVNVVGSLTAGTLVGDASGVTNIGAAAIADGSITVADVDFASSNGINIPQLASAPGGASAGQMYYNTGDNKLYVHNGSSFIEVGSGSSGGSGGSGELFDIQDEKAPGTSGGTFTLGAWRTRDLNTVKTNEITGASLSSNQITLPAGTYTIVARAPAYKVARHQAKLRNISDSSDVLIGSSEMTWTVDDTTTSSIITGSFTITSTKVFEIQHQSSATKSTNGFGDQANFGVNPVYTQVRIIKKATGSTSTILTDADNDTEIKVEDSSDEDKIRFSTANTERMIIDNNGNTGIGTASPESKLDVDSGTNDNPAVFRSSGDPGAYIGIRDDTTSGNITVGVGAIGNSLVLRANNQNAIAVESVSGEAMRITSSGNVGIGTATPNNTLQVAGTTFHGLSVTTSSGDPMIQFQTSTNGGNTISSLNNGWSLRQDQSDSDKFQWRYDNSAKMTVETSGSVGIGTTSPTYALDVETASSSYVASFVNTTTSGDPDGIRIQTGPTSNPGTGSNFVRFDDGDGTLIGQIEGNGSGGISYTTTSDRRLKDNIVNTHYRLSDLLNIKVRDYNYKTSTKRVTGFVAQELYDVYPEAVSRPADEENDIWGVDYAQVTPLLVKGVQELHGLCEMSQEQQESIEQLAKENKIRNDEQDREIASLREENRQLKENQQVLEERLKKLEAFIGK